MKLKLVLLLALFSVQSTFAQNAKEVLDKVSSTYASGSGFILSFTLNTEDIANKRVYTHDGKAYMKGNKFKINVPDGITWFDGKTQWTYIDGSEEVNVTNPTGEELASISPAALLSIYKTGFKLSHKGTKVEGGKTIHTIEMVPQKKGSDVSKFVLKVDKATNLLTEVLVKGKDKVDNKLIIKNTERNIKLTDDTFVFNKKDYPKAEIVDLR